MQTLKRWRRALGAIIVLIGLAAGAAAAAGSYNVGATDPHVPLVERALRNAMVRSVRAHAADVAKPPGIDLRDPAYAARGFGHYSAACRTCHGAPGQRADPWMFIYPSAPELARAEVTDAWSDEELFWILKHGIKDTGMMALGPTHKDADIWAVTAFVRQLPRMTPARYRELTVAQQAKQAATMASSPTTTAHDHQH